MIHTFSVQVRFKDKLRMMVAIASWFYSSQQSDMRTEQVPYLIVLLHLDFCQEIKLVSILSGQRLVRKKHICILLFAPIRESNVVLIFLQGAGNLRCAVIGNTRHINFICRNGIKIRVNSFTVPS